MSQTLPAEQLTRLAQQFGTPLYVYHAEKIKEQYEKLTTAFQRSNTLFFYACKALTNVSILKYICQLGSGIDCSSINEVRLALYAGFPKEHILYTSNGIGFDEIEEAQSLGVIINIDSLSNLEKFGQRFGDSYPVGVRLRPNIMAGGNLKISTGHEKSTFGIPVDQVEKVLALVKQYRLKVADLHNHTGSEKKDVDVFVKGIDILFDLIPRFSDLQFIDLGGGFKVPVKEGDTETDIPQLAQKVEAAFASHTPANPPKAPNNKLSSRSWRTICHLVAPMANRIAISFRRPAPRVSNSPATLAHPVSSTTKAAMESIHNGSRKSPARYTENESKSTP